MACVVVPALEGLVVYGLATIISSQVFKNSIFGIRKDLIVHNLHSLSGYLLGGAFLLAIEHIWHGEISFSFPFLTAMNDPNDTQIMLHEMSTVGVSMAGLVTLFWLFTVIIPVIFKKFHKVEA